MHPPAYMPFYCEENTWKLLAAAPQASRWWGVILGQPRGRCAVFGQRLAARPDVPVLWDYHAIALEEAEPRVRVYDLDSVLSPGTDFESYAALALAPARALPARLRPEFRLLPAVEFVARFDSDRSHMRAADGSWQAPPPPWPCIRALRDPWTVHSLVDFTLPGPGERLGLDDFIERFSQGRKSS